MAEPIQLLRGKKFQKIVQNNFMYKNNKQKILIEQNVSFDKMETIKKLRGRIDILIMEDDSDFRVIYEIKATDWDKIKYSNIKKNIYRHQKQLFNYIDTYTQVFDLWPNLALLYPQPPKDIEKKKLIETYSPGKYGVPVYWFSEIEHSFNISQLY